MKKNKTIAYMLAATLLVGGTFVGTKALFTDDIDVASELAISTGDVDIEVIGTNKWVLERNGNEYTSDGSSNIEDRGTTKNDRVTIEHNEESNQQENPEGATSKTVFANNLKSGDRLYKEIIIQNKGTLIAETTVGNNFVTTEQGNTVNKLGSLAGLVTPTATIVVDTDETDGFGQNDKKLTNYEKFELNPGQKAKITLELNVNKNDYKHKAPGTLGIDFNSDSQENYVAKLNGAWILNAQQVTK